MKTNTLAAELGDLGAEAERRFPYAVVLLSGAFRMRIASARSATYGFSLRSTHAIAT